MASEQSIPCPMCGRMNPVTRKTCSNCDYAFVPDEGGADQPSVIRRAVRRLTGSRSR